jgi:hypothetical protein
MMASSPKDASLGPAVSLTDFIRETGRELSEISGDNHGGASFRKEAATARSPTTP